MRERSVPEACVEHGLRVERDGLVGSLSWRGEREFGGRPFVVTEVEVIDLWAKLRLIHEAPEDILDVGKRC